MPPRQGQSVGAPPSSHLKRMWVVGLWAVYPGRFMGWRLYNLHFSGFFDHSLQGGTSPSSITIPFPGRSEHVRPSSPVSSPYRLSGREARTQRCLGHEIFSRSNKHLNSPSEPAKEEALDVEGDHEDHQAQNDS